MPVALAGFLAGNEGESSAPLWGEDQRSRFTAAALGLAREVPVSPGAAALRGAVDGRVALHNAM